jgi:hypothetical protein
MEAVHKKYHQASTSSKNIYQPEIWVDSAEIYSRPYTPACGK